LFSDSSTPFRERCPPRCLPCLHINLPILFDRHAYCNAGIHIAGKINITDRPAINAARFLLQLLDDLTGPDFRRAGKGARRKMGLDRVAGIVAVPETPSTTEVICMILE
jgi:hypothetical protein